LPRDGDSVVLCYHAVSETWPERFSVTPAALEEHVRRMLRRGYRPLTFSAVVHAGPDERVFAVTFDDAYGSVRERALPILDRLGVPATVFAISELAETGAPVNVVSGGWEDTEHESELRSMPWEELGTLVDDHGWEVGSHTRTHPKLTQLADDELEAELSESRAAAERALGRPCTSLAYPYGDFDARVARAAAAAGYTAAGTLFPGRPDRPSPLQWPRVGINHHHSPRAFRLKTSRLVRSLRTSGPAATALDLTLRARGRRPASRPTA
jgi:peptidoglycan/xylan/chitin deacetylase (PgdA/CDA1 family)